MSPFVLCHFMCSSYDGGGGDYLIVIKKSEACFVIC